MTLPILNLVVIRSVNLELAEIFYKKLGLNFTRHSHGKGPEHLACKMDGFVFEVYPRQSEIDSTLGTRIGFRLNELDQLVKILRESNSKIIVAPKDSPWGRRAVVEDPDGHKVELIQAI